MTLCCEDEIKTRRRGSATHVACESDIGHPENAWPGSQGTQRNWRQERTHSISKADTAGVPVRLQKETQHPNEPTVVEVDGMLYSG
mmetsp:Transcript_1177/g.7645  ORF Transcript_1177/g.7645 Transcript_1177/m.7645 type:complete len:86 (-) Transcript_1177:1809-2066(-)